MSKYLYFVPIDGPGIACGDISVSEVLVMLLCVIVDTRQYDIDWVVLQVGTRVEIFKVTTVQQRCTVVVTKYTLYVASSRYLDNYSDSKR